MSNHDTQVSPEVPDLSVLRRTSELEAVRKMADRLDWTKVVDIPLFAGQTLVYRINGNDSAEVSMIFLNGMMQEMKVEVQHYDESEDGRHSREWSEVADWITTTGQSIFPAFAVWALEATEEF